MTNHRTYAFAARYEKPGYLKVEDYVWDKDSIIDAVLRILEKTTVVERYTRRGERRNVDLMRGSTEKGVYAFARVNPEIIIVSEDWQLVSQIRFQYRERTVTSPKRIPRGMVRLDSDVHQMMHELLDEDLRVPAASGEQIRLPM